MSFASIFTKFDSYLFTYTCEPIKCETIITETWVVLGQRGCGCCANACEPIKVKLSIMFGEFGSNFFADACYLI